MPISVTCACGKEYTFKDEFAGRRAKCPACGQVVVIPGERATAASRLAPAGLVIREPKEASNALLYGGLGVVAGVVVIGLGIVGYFAFKGATPVRPSDLPPAAVPVAATTTPAATPAESNSPASPSPTEAKPPAPPTAAAPAATEVKPPVTAAPATIEAKPPTPAPPVTLPSGPAWARMIVDGSFAVTEGGLGIVAGYGDEVTKPDGTFYAGLTQGGPAVVISRYAHVVPSNPDEEWAEIHPETFNKQLSLEETIRKYGTPTRIARCPCNLGLASGAEERTVLYHWYGPLAIMTEEDGKTLAGMAFRLPLLKEIYKEGNNLLAVARRHLQDAPDSSKPRAESAAPPSSGNDKSSSMVPAPASQEDVRRVFGIGVAVKPLPPEAVDTLLAKAPEIAAGFSNPEWGEYKEDPTRKDGLWLVATVKKSLKLEEVVARAGQEESREIEGDRTWHKYGWICFGVISEEVKFVRVDVLRMMAVVLALAEQEKAASQ